MSFLTRLLGLAAFTAVLLLTSCTTSRNSSAELFTVQGNLAVRGNEPFARHVLMTDNSNYYVLVFSETTAPASPAFVRVTGRLYEGMWEGRRYAHIDVASIEEID